MRRSCGAHCNCFRISIVTDKFLLAGILITRLPIHRIFDLPRLAESRGRKDDGRTKWKIQATRATIQQQARECQESRACGQLRVDAHSSNRRIVHTTSLPYQHLAATTSHYTTSYVRPKDWCGALPCSRLEQQARLRERAGVEEHAGRPVAEKRKQVNHFHPNSSE